jgi:hypothetical protein
MVHIEAHIANLIRTVIVIGGRGHKEKRCRVFMLDAKKGGTCRNFH